MFLFSDYWPQPKVGELRVFDFGLGADNLPYSFIIWNTGDNRHFYQEDYHNNKWQSTWHLDYFDPRGILETADEYPKYSYQWWTSYRTTSFYKGKEILWGGAQEVGDEFNAPCQIDPIASTKFETPQLGNQRVKFCSLKKDILEIEYDQTWGATTSGWRAFHKKGVGITQIIWRSNGKDVGGPMTATVNTIKGKIVNKYPVVG